MREEQRPIKYHMRSVKGSLVLYTEEGTFEYLPTTDLRALITSPQPYVFQAKSLSGGSVDPFLIQTRITHANVIAVRQHNSNRLAIFECLTPYIKQESILDGFSFKFPMFIVAFVVVIAYQVFKRKSSGGTDEGDTSLAARLGKGRNLSAKAQKDLNEIEKMMSQLGDLSSSVKNMTGGSGVPAAGRKR